jgi:hypothetical protein
VGGQAAAYRGGVGEGGEGRSGWRVYPCGNQAQDCSRANFWHGTGQCVGDTTAAGSHPSWASPTGPASGTSKVLRSSGWSSRPDGVRLARRYDSEPGGSSHLVGFRGAGAAPGQSAAALAASVSLPARYMSLPLKSCRNARGGDPCPSV